jgi:hypothetical protein
MNDSPDASPPEGHLEDWEKALTIHVGTAYACRKCKNLVMVTKGGIGVLELVCCGKPMERLARCPEESGENGE